MQQLLSQKSNLKRFLNDEQAERISRTFIGLYNLDPEEEKRRTKDEDEIDLDQVFKNVKEKPNNYVLKPQREGGGNNIYNEKIPAFLEKLEKENGLSSWILMDRIFPPSSEQIFFRDGKTKRAEAISELGIFSVFLGETSCVKDQNTPRKILLNEYAGYLLRTKSISENEGGVNQGSSAIDSICLNLNL